MTRFLVSLALVAILAVPGCIAIGGNSKTTPPTLGQQLVDLKGAYDQGAMTEEEYQDAKERLIYDNRSMATSN